MGSRIVEFFRDGDWLTEERVVAYSRIALVCYVIAVARHPETLPQGGPGMISAAADVLDRAALAGALAGADAVVSAAGIGASRQQPTAVYSEGTANILRAMDAHGISKLAVISAVPAGPRARRSNRASCTPTPSSGCWGHPWNG